MSDSQEVMAVLEAARDRVARNWAQGTNGGDFEIWSGDEVCASTGIRIAVADARRSSEVEYAAHVALLRGAGIPVPDGGPIAAIRAVWYWNDAQTSVDPVLAAFDKAIAMVRAELERPKQLPTGSHSCLGNPRRPPRRGGSPSLLDNFRGRPATGRMTQAGGPG